MGANLSRAMGKIFGNKEMRILMLGLDAAGKTSTHPIHRSSSD
jgi:ADP-ribosylation factor protein 6